MQSLVLIGANCRPRRRRLQRSGRSGGEEDEPTAYMSKYTQVNVRESETMYTLEVQHRAS
jgi:hypothetical protein